MIVINFLKFIVLDYFTDRVILPPRGYSLDYADDTEGLLCFKSNETVSAELFNSFENKPYTLITPISYKVEHRKIKIVRT